MFATMNLIPAGQFWTRPHLVDSSDEELEAVIRGEIAPERVQHLKNTIKLACDYMIIWEAAGRC